jgi:hypothetical protein
VRKRRRAGEKEETEGGEKEETDGEIGETKG